MEAFAKLFETRYQLFVILIGAIFLLTAALNGDISIGGVAIPIDQTYDKILGRSGIAFFIIAFFLIFIGSFIQISETAEKHTEEIDQSGSNGSIFLHQKQQINDLDRTLKQIEELTAGEDDYVSQSVQGIIRKVGQTLIEIRERPKRLELLVKWIEKHKKDWIKQIPKSAHKQVSWRKKRLFFSELEAHIDLLKDNIESGKFGVPEKVGLTRHISDPTPYIRSMSMIEKLASKDLDKADPNVLGGDERAVFFRYMRRLIQDI